MAVEATDVKSLPVLPLGLLLPSEMVVHCAEENLETNL